MIEHGMDQDQFFFTISVICTGIGYLVYWVLGNSERFIAIFTKQPKGSVAEVVVRRIFGFVMMGVLPLVVVMSATEKTPGDLGLDFEANVRVLYWLIGLGIPSIAVNWAAGYNEDNNSVYPQIRKPEWSVLTFIIEYGTWTLYLIGYEFLFRGLLFYASLNVMSPVAAIVLNVLVYAFAHLPKGNKETLGSILLGALLCIAVLRTGSMWIAFLVHIVMAWSNSIFAFVLNPRFRYVRK